MRIYQRKRITKSIFLCLVLLLALSFTAVVQAGGYDQPTPPGPSQPKPPTGKPPLDKHTGPMVAAMPELENCIGVVTWYDGNLNGIIDANEDPMDGAKVLLMTALPAPSMDPPIGPDGLPMTMSKTPMSPGYGWPSETGKWPSGPLPDGPMPPQKTAGSGFAKFQVEDGRMTRDGGIAVFCDLEPGEYILQADAVEGITYGDNRQLTMLEQGGYAVVAFGFTYLNGAPETVNGNGA